MPLGSYAVKYTNKLDQVLEAGVKTSDLLVDQSLLGELDGAGEIKVPKLTMDGLADYSRANGFVAGDASSEWETLKLSYDRGRSFAVDAVDDEEREALLSANLMGEFVRTKVVPEVDAIRFARLYENAGTKKTGSLATSGATTKAVRAAEDALEDAGADMGNLVLYVSSATKGALRDEVPRSFTNSGDPDSRIYRFDDIPIVTVPSARFKTSIELLDGTTTGETAGGYKAATGAVTMDFVLMEKSAAKAIQKHEKLRYFAPDVNQAKDAHLWQYRLFHDLFVMDNKKGLIYAYTATAPTKPTE